MLEGYNYRIYKDRGDITRVTVTLSKDIEKALKKKPYLTLEELKAKLPPKVYDILPLFNRREVEKLLLY